jgi:hypothetical protein
MKRLLIAFILLTIYNTGQGKQACPWDMSNLECDYSQIKTAQSFMFTRQIYHNVAAQYATAWHDFVYEKPGCLGISAQAIGLYQQSLPLDKNAKYFLLNKKSSISIRGDNTPSLPSSLNRDVRAEWLNLPSNFSGIMSISPEQRQAGAWIELNYELKNCLDHELFNSLWVAIAFPIQMIENNIRISQNAVQNPASGFPSDIVEAFNQSTWEFGKMKLDKTQKIALAEVVFKIGSTFMAENGFQVGFYSLFSLATFGHQKATYVFDPFIGNNEHQAFGQGVNFQFPLNCDTDCERIALFLAIENLYLMRNFQHRTFDLRLKQWSRYLLLNKTDGTTNIPAINVLTLPVKVKPFNFVDLAAGFRYENDYIEAEFGYSMWAHGDERVYLQQSIGDTYGIAGSGPLKTASKSTINSQAPDDLVFTPIFDKDIDMHIGAARAAITHKFYASLSGLLTTEASQCGLGFGAYFEFPQQNTALENWGIWVKIDGSF